MVIDANALLAPFILPNRPHFRCHRQSEGFFVIFSRNATRYAPNTPPALELPHAGCPGFIIVNRILII